jgi:hypothetical protein
MSEIYLGSYVENFFSRPVAETLGLSANTFQNYTRRCIE